MKYYIAYGSNLDKEQMAYRCPGAKVVAKSWIHDYRLVYQGRPIGAHANVIPAPGSEVPVAVWSITESDEEALDIYEGVRGGYYTKEYMTIDVAGEPKDCLIYIMTPNPYGMPSEPYERTLLRGYYDFNFDQKYLDEALAYSYKRTR